MYSLKYTFLLLLFFNIGLYAQDYTSIGDAPKKALNAFEEGVYQMREKEYAKAELAFLKAIKIAPSFIDAHWNLAELYYTQKDYDKAEALYIKCTQLSIGYKPQTLFTLGLLQERQQHWAKAADWYDTFLKLRRDPELIKKATYQAAYCRFRAFAYANPVNFVPTNLGKNINSKHDEYLPSLAIDGKTLIYTVHIDNKNEEFYIAQANKDKTWQTATNMGAPLNTPRNEGAQTIAANGKTIVFSACNREDGLGSCDFYISDFVNNAWTTPKNMGATINTKYWDGHASLSADGNQLYLSSNRKAINAIGDDDIYVASRNANGTWQEPFVLPSTINTAYGERSPFIHADGRTLYFSSTGHAGMGKSDMFSTQRDENGNWTKPINLGYPINTTGADWSLVVAADGKTALYSAQRADSEGGMDLYQFELPENVRAIPTTFVRGIVQDFEYQTAIAGAKCNLVDLGTQKTVTVVQTAADGTFLLPLPTGKRYSLTIQQPNYTFFSDNFELQGLYTAEKPYEKVVFLQNTSLLTDNMRVLEPTKPLSISENTSHLSKNIILKNIFFKTNSSILLPESDYELAQLLALLNETPDLKIQINGHTDSDGDAVSNQILSEKRANAVVGYLITHNIDKKRLFARGFGESQPIGTNDTPDGKANNRRTEFVVL